MSSTGIAPANTTKATATKRTHAPSAPIVTLNNDLARTLTHLHPLLVLSTFALRFDGLVVDPVSTLTSSLGIIGILQLAYVVLCLPAVGSADAISAKSTGSSSTRRKGDVIGSKRISTAIFSALLSLLVGTPLITFILVLFGAPVTTHVAHTILCAAHLAVLGALPLFYVHGVNKESWRRVGALLMPLDEVYGAAIGSFLGSWIGAVPIPLDWDREWQKWPVTIVTGAYVGWAIGKLAGKYLFYGKTIDLSG